MNIETLQTLIDEVLPWLFVSLGITTSIKLTLHIVGDDCSYGLMDYISDFIDWVKSIFHKSKEKNPVEFSSEWDNGFFNSDFYNSGGEKID